MCCLSQVSFYVTAMCCLCQVSFYVTAVCCLCRVSFYVTAVCCLCQVSEQQLELVRSEVLQRVVDGMKDEGTPYVGE